MSESHSSSRLAEIPYIRDAVFDGPVGLVAVKYGALSNVMTASFFSEGAHHPTSMWISVARSTYTHELLLRARSFAFIVLHSGQADLAMRCGLTSGRERDKCADLDLYAYEDDFLFLNGAIASTACRVGSSVPVGDHTLFIGHILSGHRDTDLQGRRHLLLSDLRRA